MKKTTRGALLTVLTLCLLLAGCTWPGAGQPESASPAPTGAADTTAPTEATEVTAPTDAPAPLSPAQQTLAAMTLREKVYQLFIVRPEQLSDASPVTKTDAATAAALDKAPVGGVVYFGANIVSPDQCIKMIATAQSYSSIPLFVAVDEEGGLVARLGNNPAMGTTKFPPMGEIDTVDGAYEVGRTIGADLRKYGFNLDFAPVADVNSNPDNPVIGDRSFSSDPATVAELVTAAVEGFHDSGMLCTLKHFPGHGDTTTDSHLGYTVHEKTRGELERVEFVPFSAGAAAGADFVMVAHISLPRVTGDALPATLSKPVIDLLKEEIGFDGVIITDSLEMEAITDNYSAGEAALLAVKAGVDMLLMPSDLDAAAGAVISAVESGEISLQRLDESVLKILNAKAEAGLIGP